LSATARQAQQAHTSGMSPGLSYPLAPTSNTKRSRLQAPQRMVQLGGQIEDGVAGSLASGTPYTRDEMGPVVPTCLENSTLIAQRPRTYTQPTQPTSCWSTACTHTTRPPRGQASPVFFFCCVLLHVYRGVILDLTVSSDGPPQDSEVQKDRSKMSLSSSLLVSSDEEQWVLEWAAA